MKNNEENKSKEINNETNTDNKNTQKVNNENSEIVNDENKQNSDNKNTQKINTEDDDKINQNADNKNAKKETDKNGNKDNIPKNVNFYTLKVDKPFSDKYDSSVKHKVGETFVTDEVSRVKDLTNRGLVHVID